MAHRRTDDKEMLISALFDDEVSSRAVLVSRNDISREVEAMRRLRDGVRTWHQSEMERCEALDLWADLAPELTRLSAPREWRWLEQLREWLAPIALGGAVTAAVLLLSLGSGTVPIEGADQSVGEGGPGVRLVLTDAMPENTEVLPGLNIRFDGREEEPEVSVMENVQRVGLSGGEELQLRVPSPVFRARQAFRRGLSAGDVDIEWIRTDRPLNIVPARRTSVPPVIWVAQHRD